MITVKWMESSCSVRIDETTTFTSFVEKLLDKWEGLLRVDFSLHNGEKGVEINNDAKLAIFFAANYSTVSVNSPVVGFSKLNKETVFKWAGIYEIIADDSHFTSIDIDLDNTLHAQVIEHAVQDLIYTNELYGPVTDCADTSVREFISSVVLACAKITENVKLIAELSIVGKKAKGRFDYAMLYKNFFLLITEAKKDNLYSGLIKNIGQLVASREESLYKLAPKKRSYMSMAGDIASIPSTGVVSNGNEWFLTRYVLLPQPTVFKSSPFSLRLIGGTPADIRRALLKLMSTLLGAIDFHKRAVDQYGSAKAQRREGDGV